MIIKYDNKKDLFTNDPLTCSVAHKHPLPPQPALLFSSQIPLHDQPHFLDPRSIDPPPDNNSLKASLHQFHLLAVPTVAITILLILAVVDILMLPIALLPIPGRHLKIISDPLLQKRSFPMKRETHKRTPLPQAAL